MSLSCPLKQHATFSQLWGLTAVRDIEYVVFDEVHYVNGAYILFFSRFVLKFHSSLI